MTTQPSPLVRAEHRPLTLEQATLLQRIWGLYRFGLPDLEVGVTTPGDSRPRRSGRGRPGR